MTCPRCPCPLICLRLEAYCVWAAERPSDPVKTRHICDASSGVARRPAAESQIALAEAIALTRSMEDCPYRSTRGCGCGGAACALRGAGRVTHLDCFQCLRDYP